MKLSFSSKNFVDSRSHSKFREVNGQRKLRVIKMPEFKESKHIKSNRSSYFGSERNNIKN